MAKLQHLEQILAQLKQGQTWQRPRYFRDIVGCWRTLVGPQIHQNAQPHKLQDGLLWVATSSHVWAQQLLFQREVIKEKLLAQIPGLELREIRFTTKNWGEQTAPTPNSRQSSALSDRPFSFAPTEDPAERLDQIRQVAQWRLAQWSPCPRCQLPAHQASLDRWQYCSDCRRKHLAQHNQPH